MTCCLRGLLNIKDLRKKEFQAFQSNSCYGNISYVEEIKGSKKNGESEETGPGDESDRKDEREDLGVDARFKGIHDGRMNSFSRGWATLPLVLGRKIGLLRAEIYR